MVVMRSNPPFFAPLKAGLKPPISPLPIRAWLEMQGSLTKHLTALAGGQFRVEICQHGWGKITDHEAKMLGVPRYTMAWIREVNLYGNSEQAWVKARSIIPISSLNKKARIFRYLGKKPMGKVLFFRHNPQCQRWIYPTALGWARMNRYQWHGCPLLVEEVFLAEFERVLQHLG